MKNLLIVFALLISTSLFSQSLSIKSNQFAEAKLKKEEWVVKKTEEVNSTIICSESSIAVNIAGAYTRIYKIVNMSWEAADENGIEITDAEQIWGATVIKLIWEVEPERKGSKIKTVLFYLNAATDIYLIRFYHKNEKKIVEFPIVDIE